MGYGEQGQAELPLPSEFDLLVSAPAPEHPVALPFVAASPVSSSPPVDARSAPSPAAGFAEGEGAVIANALSGELRRDRKRARAKVGPSVVLDGVALVLAFVLPPLGLLAGFAALLLGSRANGFASGVAKAATSIAVVLSLALAGALVVISDLTQKDQAFAALVASSRDYCTRLETSDVFSSQTLRWPAPAGTVSDSLAAMGEFEAFWLELEAVAPEGVGGEANAIAEAARTIITSVETSRLINHANNLEVMRAVAESSRIPAWMTQYCQ